MAEPKGTSTPTGSGRREEQHDVARSSRESMQRRQHEDERLGFPGTFSSSPFGLMRRMTEEMDRAFDRMFGDLGFGGLSPRSWSGGGNPASGIWSPRVEVFQKDDAFVVRAELPGLKKDDVEVNVTEDAITIQGQRREEQERKQEGYYHSERSYGSFYRTIPLPEGVITDSAKASFKDGILEVRLQAPPNEVSRGRRIDISEGEGDNK